MFKEMKAEETSISKWKSILLYLTELQPSVDDWSDVYEVIVSEEMLCQHGHIESNESNFARALSVNEDNRNENSTKEALETTVVNGDPDEPENQCTSLFNLITNHRIMITNTNTIYIDFSISDSSPNKDWKWTRKKFNPYLYLTEKYGPVMVLKGVY